MYLRDVYPTACELAGVPIPESVEGRSVAPVLRGETESIRPHVFCHFRDVQRMIRTDRWKLIHYPKIGRRQLFDLAGDPFERHDLSTDARRAPVLAELRAKLRAAQERFGDPLLREQARKETQ
jgi:arylsulfatase A-like enzyme